MVSTWCRSSSIHSMMLGCSEVSPPFLFGNLRLPPFKALIQECPNVPQHVLHILVTFTTTACTEGSELWFLDPCLCGSYALPYLLYKMLTIPAMVSCKNLSVLLQSKRVTLVWQSGAGLLHPPTVHPPFRRKGQKQRPQVAHIYQHLARA